MSELVLDQQGQRAQLEGLSHPLQGAEDDRDQAQPGGDDEHGGIALTLDQFAQGAAPQGADQQRQGGEDGELNRTEHLVRQG